MVKAGKAGIGPRATHASALVLIAFGLAACGANPREATRAGSALELAAPAPGRAVERDVPAPNVFSVTESGLWDGRPSLGGVWVAHPGADDPERVAIRNTQTGAEVIGALFRRERENPGPRFQISSEAASALGILAGQPAVIEVIALRMERVEPAAAAAAPAAAELAAAPADPAAAEAPAEPRRGLFRRAEPAAPAAAEAPAVAPVQPLGAPVDSVAITDVDPAPAAPRRGLRDLFRRDAAPAEAPGITATALAPAAPMAATSFLSDSDEARPAVQGEPGVIAPVAAAEPRPRRGLRDMFRRDPAPVAEPVAAAPALIPLPEPAVAAPAPVPVRAPAPGPTPARGVDRPFVQVGIFAVEGNAQRTLTQMRAAGLPAEVRAGRSGERDFWRVVVGPAADPAAQAQHLARARALGFGDAYTVAR